MLKAHIPLATISRFRTAKSEKNVKACACCRRLLLFDFTIFGCPFAFPAK
jgi:hypothetical protein